MTINYQGRISLTYGAQVADGPYTPVFNLYHQASGGTADWSESDSVNTKNGLFSVVLGQVTSLSALPGDQPYWLEVVWAGQTMSPRQPLTSAPYALWAGSVDLPLTGTTNSGGAAISVTNTGGPGVAGFGSTGVAGKGSLTGVQGQAASAGATGVFADYGGFGSSYALKVSGPAQFWGGPVSFTGGVDFSGAAVTGLSGGVSVPLTLSGAVAFPGTVLSATNTGSGYAGVFNAGGSAPALLAQGSTVALSATVSSLGPAAYVQANGGGFKPALLAVTGGTGHGVEGDNTQFNSVGMLAGDPIGGATGVFGLANNHGVEGESLGGIGVRGLGPVGVEGLVTATGQTGLLGDWGGFANGYALKVSGPAQFWGGPVSFTSSVDFTGATVTGLAVTVPVPLTLTSASAGTVLNVTNTGAGNAAVFYATGGGVPLYVQGTSTGVSATSSSGPSLYAENNSGGGFQPTILAYAHNTNHAVEARNATYGSLGVLGGTMTQGFVGVYGSSANGNQGVWGESGQGAGVYGDGAIGVEGKVTGTGATALLGDYGGFSGSYALKVSGPAQFWGGAVSFTGAVDFTGATVTGLGAAQSVTASVAWPAGVFNANNIGTGYGVFGRSTSPGSADAQGNPLTINAGVYGYANVSLAAGVYGVSGYALTGAAGVVAIGPTGIYGVGNGSNGQGGSFQANSGTAVNAQGLNGIQVRSGTGGKALELQPSLPTDTALQIDNGTSIIDGTVLAMANAVSGTAVVRVQQSQVGSGGEAIYGSTGASATAAIMGESFDTTAPNSSGTASAGIYGRGASGVTGVSNNPSGFGLLGSVDATGAANSAGVFANNAGLGYGVNAQGLTGTASRPNVPGGLGLLASDGNLGGSTLALMAQGASVFNGPVQFNGTVSGLGMAVSAPLSLTAGLGGPIISGTNTGAGPGVSGTALVANVAGVVGENDVFNGLGLLGLSANGLGIVGVGSTVGVSATATGANGIGLYARDSSNIGTVTAYNDNSSVSNSALFGETKGGYGVYGYSLGVNGVGVLGQGNDIGVQATLNGTSGDGFNDNVTTSGNAAYLVNNAGNGIYGAGSTHGVQAGLVGNTGQAFYSNVSTSANLMDVTNNGTGNAIMATADGGAVAVYGSNNTNAGGTAGVRGDSNATSGLTYGVYGFNGNASGYGVYGTNNAVGAVATGGVAANGVGVYGTTSFGYPSITGVGVLGNSAGLAGVYGLSTAGMGVIANGASVGLSATATGGPAVIGRANTAGTTIQGINDDGASTASGVLGAGSGSGIGVKGQVVGGAAGSIGVYGVNNVAGAYGIQADNTNATASSGAALFVNGLLKVATASYTDPSTSAAYTGPTIPGSSGRVSFSFGKATVTSIGPVTCTMVSPNSTVLVTFATSQAFNGYGITIPNAGGSFTIHFPSAVSLSSGDVMNFVIINQ